MREKIIIGQRWISIPEEELGLGTVVRVEEGRVKIFFRSAGVERTYSMTRAPLKRAVFSPGETVETREGQSILIEEAKENDGLIYYIHSSGELCETELADTVSYNPPVRRLADGDFDPGDHFIIRYKTLLLQEKRMKSPVRGLCGPRLDLIPHQLYIAEKVISRHLPRVMLSDQVGLGKTIEALLIINALLLTGRIHRILIVLPEHLILQWFGELYHRLGRTFTIIDREDYERRVREEPEYNPFLEHCLCDSRLFATHPELRTKALEGSWDMVVVDEVHNLCHSSREYPFFKELAARTGGLILLTAIPEHPNLEDFFSRLHLIDPLLYDRYDRFFWEVDRYHYAADLAEKILKKHRLTEEDRSFLREKMPTEYLGRELPEEEALGKEERQKIVEYLIDQHGMGRLLFRNTRKTINNLPSRKVHLIPLESHDPGALFHEFRHDMKESPHPPAYNFAEDGRVEWLLTLFASMEKVLVICNSRQKVIALESALRAREFTALLSFHEGIKFIERDKRVSSFASSRGPRVLISSELGSEGRNFQFCSNIVFFDIPFDPDLIEQRIGRLDRIGQSGQVNIYLPLINGSPQSLVAHWFHEGLNLFQEVHDGHNRIFSLYSPLIKNMALNPGVTSGELEQIIKETNKEFKKVIRQNEKGRDKLIEMNSFDQKEAEAIIKEIEKTDNDRDFEHDILDLFEFFNFDYEVLGGRSYLVKTGEFQEAAFGGKKKFTITFDRSSAVEQTGWEFMTMDNPLTWKAVDLLLSRNTGNCVFAEIYGDRDDLLLEVIFLLESLSPGVHNIHRFLPPAPIRVCVNREGRDLTEELSHEELNEEITGYEAGDYARNRETLREASGPILGAAENIARERAREFQDRALNLLEEIMGKELKRIKSLRKVNPHIKEDEVEQAAGKMALCRNHITSARLRIDSLRLIREIKR